MPTKNNTTIMETKHNELYAAPVAEALELKPEGIICQSNGNAEVQNYYWNGLVAE